MGSCSSGMTSSKGIVCDATMNTVAIVTDKNDTLSFSTMTVSYTHLRFVNLVVNGRKITDDMPGKPKWYKTGDMAGIFVGEHVENLSFE